MLTIPHNAKQVALASFLAGVSLWSASAASAQTLPATPAAPPPAVREDSSRDGLFLTPLTQTPTLVDAPTAKDATPAAPPTVAGVPTPPAPAAAQPCAGTAPESPWANIPANLRPTPRPGWFYLPPSGPGYYTALDAIKGDCKDKPPPSPYPAFGGSFYDCNFRYLDAGGQPVDCLDNLKRMHLGGICDPNADNWLLSIGGEERVQIKNEIDSRLTAKDNDYQLLRTRAYADLWFKDEFRVYAEFLDARTFNEDLPPLAIDKDQADILNLFFDAKLGEIDNNPIYARVGRQELLYGSQRLISTLDWANTRRTFDGAKIFYHSDVFDIDAFYTRPVVVSPSHLDSSDWNRQFAGVWATLRPQKGQEIDAYYLYLDEDLKVPFGYVSGGRGGYDVNTLGGRYSGDHKIMEDCCADRGSILWEAEAALQLGSWSDRNLCAGMANGGVGYAATQLPMQPQFWVTYDWASGTQNPSGTGTFTDFNQLFPFGHYYFGYLDFVGRQNIRDLSFQGTVFPTKWMTGLVQYHFFTLDDPRSPLFGTAPNFAIERVGAPSGIDGVNVGQEIDFTLNMNLTRHSSVLLGFSKFYAGTFIDKSGPAVNPELYYIQYSFKW